MFSAIYGEIQNNNEKKKKFITNTINKYDWF